MHRHRWRLFQGHINACRTAQDALAKTPAEQLVSRRKSPGRNAGAFFRQPSALGDTPPCVICATSVLERFSRVEIRVHRVPPRRMEVADNRTTNTAPICVAMWRERPVVFGSLFLTRPCLFNWRIIRFEFAGTGLSQEIISGRRLLLRVIYLLIGFSSFPFERFQSHAIRVVVSAAKVMNVDDAGSRALVIPKTAELSAPVTSPPDHVTTMRLNGLERGNCRMA